LPSVFDQHDVSAQIRSAWLMRNDLMIWNAEHIERSTLPFAINMAQELSSLAVPKVMPHSRHDARNPSTPNRRLKRGSEKDRVIDASHRLFLGKACRYYPWPCVNVLNLRKISRKQSAEEDHIHVSKMSAPAYPVLTTPIPISRYDVAWPEQQCIVLIDKISTVDRLHLGGCNIMPLIRKVDYKSRRNEPSDELGF